MVTAARCYHCAIFALGALTGMCLSFFSAVPFVYGIAVGFALYLLMRQRQLKGSGIV